MLCVFLFIYHHFPMDEEQSRGLKGHSGVGEGWVRPVRGHDCCQWHHQCPKALLRPNSQQHGLRTDIYESYLATNLQQLQVDLPMPQRLTSPNHFSLAYRRPLGLPHPHHRMQQLPFQNCCINRQQGIGLRCQQVTIKERKPKYLFSLKN